MCLETSAHSQGSMAPWQCLEYVAQILKLSEPSSESFRIARVVSDKLLYFPLLVKVKSLDPEVRGSPFLSCAGNDGAHVQFCIY